MVIPRSGAEIFVRTRTGWLGIRNEVDLERPARVFGRVLLGGGLVSVLLAFGIAAAATHPLTRAKRAMERVGDGDLSHRLPESGPVEIAQVARAFNAMTERVSTLLQSERELLAGVSHELRTPITRLRLVVELLRDTDTPERHLDGMQADLSELEALIAELLELSRLQLGDQVLAREPTGLLDIAAGVSEQSARIVVSGRAKTLSIDRRLLTRALDNVVRNALIYAPDGPIEIAVQDWGFRVLDRGPGVPLTALPRLFDAFYRVDRSRTRETGGTGVGLRIVQQVAELHGGYASASLRSGGGLVVEIRLRSAPVDGRQ